MVPSTPPLAPPQHPTYIPPSPRQGLPTWAMSILFTLAFAGIVAGAYFVIEYMKTRKASAPESAAAGSAKLETPSAAGARRNPLQKYLEVVGIRLTQNKAKKTEVRFVVVNHSAAEIADLAATVKMVARTNKQGEESVGSFSFKLPSLGPYDSKELTAILDTKLQVYELPDWQNLREVLEITSQ
ncbi:MAG: hypothetical protein ABIZ80_18950 [Bryobacteraceae bacterium]